MVCRVFLFVARHHRLPPPHRLPARCQRGVWRRVVDLDVFSTRLTNEQCIVFLGGSLGETRE